MYGGDWKEQKMRGLFFTAMMVMVVMLNNTEGR